MNSEAKYSFPLNQNRFELYLLFTREPHILKSIAELEFYTNGNDEVIGFIALDKFDLDFSCGILTRDNTKQYNMVDMIVSIETVEEARVWIDQVMSKDQIYHHESKRKLFDIFLKGRVDQQLHPHYLKLRDHKGWIPAKAALKEVSYHYKDIDGNFIEQFQSPNGFDARIWELYLFCFFREQFFSFDRDNEAPDFIISDGTVKIAVEAVIAGRKTPIENEPKTEEEIKVFLKQEMPLIFSGTLSQKVKKEYWKQSHIKDLPFAIAIADFHDTASMTWSFLAMLEYVYGHKYEHHNDEDGNAVGKAIQLSDYVKPNGTIIPTGFFFQPEAENISAVIFSTGGTLAKFNRMGKQAEFGSEDQILQRIGYYHNHEDNATDAVFNSYFVNENCTESWSEGVIVFHNPNARVPLDSQAFDHRVAQCNFQDGKLICYYPEVFPYQSLTLNTVKV